MARVFITGVAGFLGSHLADALLAQGHDVFGCDSLIGGYMDNVPEGVSWWKTDCNNLPVMKWQISTCDVVYHCAATAYEGLSVFSPHLIAQNIYSASAAVFSAAIANKVRRVVFCSSMARYGVGLPPFSEADTPAPVDPYGIAKVAAENLLRNLALTHGFEYVIAVPHNIYGTRQKYDDPFRNVMSIMINRALQKKTIVIYGDGQQQRCFSSVKDCIPGLVKMGFQASLNGMTINIGPDEGVVTIKELADMVARHTDTDDCHMYMPGRPQEVKVAHCSSRRARDLIDYRTTVPLEIGVREMVEWIRLKGPKPFQYHLPIEFVTDKTPRTWTEQIF